MADEAQAPGTIIVNPQAAFEKSTTSPTSSDTTKSLAPEQKAQQEESAQLAHDEIAGTKPKADYDTGVAKLEAEAAKNREAIGAKTLQERTAVDEAEMAKIAAKAEALRQAQEAIKATPAPQLFASRDGWEKTRLAVGLALAGLGDAMGARASARLHESRGPSAVSDIISMDLDRQKANLQKLTDQQIMAKEGVKDAIQARELALAKVDMKGAALLNLAAQHAEALLKAKGVEAPAIAQNELILKLRRDEEQRKAQAVAGLTAEHTKNSGKTETTDRVGSTAPSPNTTPTHIADQLTGTNLPVDPTGTDSKQHNAATAKLAPVNTFLDTSTKLIREAMKNGPARNETVAGLTNGDTTQADRNAAVVRLRSAYAAAKGESVSEANAKQLEEAIPNPPSTASPKGQWNAWLAKMHEVTGEMHQLRTEYLANAGVPLDEIKKANAKVRAKFLQGEQAPAPTPATAAQGQTQPMAPPAAAPATAAPPRAPVPRANLTEAQGALFRWATSHPNDPRSSQIIANLGAR